ncbi:MAG: peptidylprolyl isomerase [Candidatus Tectomicrobia bacterium]|nr:peptidylprolyl isomerase [Candidatus Tectomicrobia bacterium]
MKIQPNTVVSIDYTLHLDSGELVDSSEESGTLDFIYGMGSIIPALEIELEGLEVGDEKKVRIVANKGYGEIDPQAIVRIPRNEFPDYLNLRVGMVLSIRNGEKELQFLVRELTEQQVTADFNHPLAGQDLNFWVAVRNIRNATQDELAQGLTEAE